MSVRTTLRGAVCIFTIILSSASLAAAQVTFANPVVYASGTSPYALASGDLNGDGRPDLVVANFGDPQSNDNGSISIFLGNGDGTFQASQVIRAGANPASVALGDFNHDGKLDIAVEDGGEPSVYILLGKGDGSFASPAKVTFGSNASFPTQIVCGDLNSDGRLDLAIANTGDNDVTILLGNGDGTFQPAAHYPVSGAPHSIAVGDFNNDKKLDIAVVNETIPTSEAYHGNISVLFGNGDGTFQSPIVTDIGGRSYWLVAADLNNDQKLDAVVTINSFLHTEVLFLTGNGDGTFGTPQQLDSFSTADTIKEYGSLALADFDKDGKLDVAEVLSFLVGSGSPPPSVVRILPGNGNGTFRAAQETTLTPFPYALLAVDLNGDGLPDIVVTDSPSNYISVLLNTPGLANNPDFLLTPASLQLSVTPGLETPDDLFISPQNGAFTETIDLSCSVAGPAPLPSCTVSPASLVPGENPTEATLSISVSKTASITPSWIDRRFTPFCVLVLGLIGISLSAFLFASHESTALVRDIWKVSTFAVLLIFLPVACGGGSNAQGNTKTNQTYIVAVTASSHSVQHSATVVVTVE